MTIHWDVVAPAIRRVMEDLSGQPFLQRFYLAGGTALALQYGHRRSVDLDFFSETDVVRASTHAEISRILLNWPDCKLEQDPSDGSMDFVVSSVRVGFYSYGYPMLIPSLNVNGHLSLASPVDIGLMKLDALRTRAARKDFVDLYFIARQIPLDDLLRLGNRKYAYARDFAVIAIENLTYFVNADKFADVDMQEPVAWDVIRGFFNMEARRLAREWFEE